VAFYGLESPDGVPVYVHAKVCIIDDQWASVGSDNFNLRSWTHDSEVTAAVCDPGYARALRLTLAGEHLALGRRMDHALHRPVRTTTISRHDRTTRPTAEEEKWNTTDSEVADSAKFTHKINRSSGTCSCHRADRWIEA
jgi:phosphatidylserine/phosphatidylglycerophosphate/cardiolipin synthase-like enzyme